jgi:twinkle protein
MGTFTHHEACPACASSDALARYDDGSGYCFACQKNFRPNGEKVEASTSETKKTKFIRDGHYEALPKRKLTEETCKKWGYQVGELHGKRAEIATYRDGTAKAVAQKVRTEDKQFSIIGEGKGMPLYGQWLWGGGGRSITITEGEIDALSFSQAFGNKSYAVVSLPSGAPSAAKAVGHSLEWLLKFEQIILCFDMDKPGRTAVDEVAKLLPPGRVKVMNLREKDANATLVKHGPQAIVDAFWKASEWRPDGIVDGKELTVERLKQAVSQGFKYRKCPLLQEKTLGLRKGELTLLTAGSGIGKSTWAREIGYDLHIHDGCSIGNVFLEENIAKTGQAYVALHHNVPLGRLRYNPDLLSPEQWETAVREAVQQRMYFYDHFGSLDSKHLLTKMRYLATVAKVDFILLDHISIVTSGVESSSEGERKDIDILMTSLRSLIEETGVGIVGIVHLKRVSGKVFNEGAQVSLSDLRGSGSLEQISDNVYALERDQQAEGDAGCNMLLRVLKCRETGDTGEADTLSYNRNTGRLELVSGFTEETNEEVTF